MSEEDVTWTLTAELCDLVIERKVNSNIAIKALLTAAALILRDAARQNNLSVTARRKSAVIFSQCFYDIVDQVVNEEDAS
jgi:hypothetical protein